MEREPGLRLSKAGEALLRDLIRDAIESRQARGAVLALGDSRRTFYCRAFGLAQVAPRRPMRTDTIFDLASLTKAIATAPGIMLLVESGRLLLSDSVSRYLPSFARGKRAEITLHHLLTHTSGLPALAEPGQARNLAQAAERIARLRLLAEPGSTVRYSDLGFMLLTEVVRVRSGESLDRFAARRIFGPLGMRDTVFNPPPSLASRCAAVEPGSGNVVVGRVSDPLAAGLGGVSGHAGLFSTARDLAIFARMILNHGLHRNRRILGSASARAMTSPQVEIAGEKRGLGWDIHTAYSSPRGDLLSPVSFGHTGYTGTSIWIDPEMGLFVILLTNWVRRGGAGNANRLRGLVANVAAAHVERRA